MEIIPVINKIDLEKADVEGTEHDIIENIGIGSENIFKISAKDGIGIEEMLQGIVKNIPAPFGNIDLPPKALIFDSYFDTYRGVIVLIRMFDGRIKKGETIKFFSTNKEFSVEEIGYLGLKKEETTELTAGEVGYIIANIKEVSDARVGDTITIPKNGCKEALPGFEEPKPMVFS